jgi:hypothetical protein
MIDVTILAVTEDPTWLDFFWSESRLIQGTRLVVSASMKEARSLLGCTNARLIVVDWQDASASGDEIDHLLWANSVLASPAPVLVVAPCYRPEDALSLFQMGVDEYLGMSEHANQLRTILDQMLARPTAQPAINVPAALTNVPRLAPELLPQPPRWVAAASSA